MPKVHSTIVPAAGKTTLTGVPKVPTTPADTKGKPCKPYPEFPLFAHRNGQWCKKIRGQLHYFGVVSDPDAALDLYLKQKDDLHAGRKPREESGAATIKMLCNAFLNLKKNRQDAGELSPLTFINYREAAELIVATFGKQRLAADLGPDDFAEMRESMVKRWGAVRVRDMIQRVRSVFKFGVDNGLLERPTHFGQGFTRPSKKTVRLERARAGPKLFTVEECRTMIDGAGVPLRAMLLLALNGGFGNSDIGNLPLSAVDLDRGIIDYPRPKTGVPRRCPLWPETVEALRAVLAKRPEPKDDADTGFFFITKYGERWAKDVRDSPVTKETKKLMNRLGINGRRGLGFYTLRHVFRTVADESKDQPAVDHIMGHETEPMSAVYREGISDARLKDVTNHVHTWLFASPAKTQDPTGEEE